jgi:hypothetical protein
MVGSCPASILFARASRSIEERLPVVLQRGLSTLFRSGGEFGTILWGGRTCARADFSRNRHCRLAGGHRSQVPQMDRKDALIRELSFNTKWLVKWERPVGELRRTLYT